jgi:hypothetical protein
MNDMDLYFEDQPNTCGSIKMLLIPQNKFSITKIRQFTFIYVADFPAKLLSQLMRLSETILNGPLTHRVIEFLVSPVI